jgi:methionyl-tRNA formyltransferase
MALKIVFMGTPDFAVPSLDALHNSNHKVVGVITSTDKYGGRGKKTLLESAVKKYAVAHNIPVLQPKNLKSPAFGEELKALNADLQVVVAFRMLPVVVWNMPRLGTMNLHGSLLPKYRGAAPINWAIIKGEKVTGLTTFLLQHEIDTGDTLDLAEVPIDYKDTAGSLHDKMMIVGANLVVNSVDKIDSGDYQLTPQNDAYVTKAPKIFSETCQIDFNQSTRNVYNFIRGLNPYPGAYAKNSDSDMMKIFNCEESVESHNDNPGDMIIENQNLKYATIDGYINVKSLQVSGKRRMNVQDYLNGIKS